MMRVRRNLIIKVAIVLLVFVFMMPYLLTLLEDSQKKSKRKVERDKLDRTHSDHQKGERDIKKDVLNEPQKDHVVVFDQDKVAPANVDKPRALTVFKQGIPGSYEKEIPKRTGPGENGEPVYISVDEKAEADQSIQQYGFNMVASDKVSLDRVVPDTRVDECKYYHYPAKLPTASVILVFHNEGWSTLIRTVHSIINMSPEHLLQEIVMVDDFSTKVHLKGQLDEYVKRFNGKVKVFRNEQREGLIMTRTLGARYSTGDVVIFLDAHCECNYNWLPPLLARIAFDRTIMAVPVVEGIDWNNMRYHPIYTTDHHRGIFEWGFLYKESRVPKEELDRREHSSEPYKSPTHAGGLFAIDRKYFFEIGAYDPGLQIWGGENFELSFKIWQCGGSIEWVPCSRVGHIYRNHMPYGFGNVNPKISIVTLNYMRVVEVWLDDEFKEYFYTREPTMRGYPIGDISKQLQFKKDHKCKSFKWFMDNIAYEVYEKFPPPPPNKGWGEIKQIHGNMCWDTYSKGVGGGPIGVSGCHHLGGNQMFRMNVEGQMAVGERCLQDTSSKNIQIGYCDVQPNGPWDWNKADGTIRHSKHNLCVSFNDAKLLELQTCNPDDPKQVYEINNVFIWK